MEICKCGVLGCQVLKCGSVEVWNCGNVEMQKCENVEVWKCAGVEVWKYRSLVARASTGLFRRQATSRRHGRCHAFVKVWKRARVFVFSRYGAAVLQRIFSRYGAAVLLRGAGVLALSRSVRRSNPKPTLTHPKPALNQP